MNTMRAERDRLATEGVVAHYSRGGFGQYHRLDCSEAPHRGDPGVRDTIHGPWKYLAAHWSPCPVCLPPADALDGEPGVQAA
ncbi:MAG: hypothetical protein ACO3PB_04760 [Miltoncostaeaceae bacterium]